MCVCVCLSGKAVKERVESVLKLSGTRRRSMSQVQEADGGDGGQEEDQVEPSVIEVELQVSKHLCDDRAILLRHVHPHQDNRGQEVHAHDLGQHEDDDDGRLGAGVEIV